jgi:ketosteroid isomerase-like protein
MTDEQQIRALIEAWAIAAHDGDMDAEVAFAYALVRCGTPADLAREPEQHLRLTLGLRKAGGRWIVLHEHHSFPDTTSSSDAAARS